MPDFKRLYLLTLLLCGVATAATAEYRVQNVNVQAARLQADIEMIPGDAMIEALENGVPLVFLFELELIRERFLLMDVRTTLFSVRKTVRFHSLSERYVVSAADGRQQSFDSRIAAFKAVGKLDWPWPEVLQTPPENLRMRKELAELSVSLDRSRLPAALRLPAVLRDGWKLQGTPWRWPAD